ncbi:hypothetical protein QFZ64_005573 [Streptomyces sp. B3I8]|nr:hypothetical protein [Streptomyces sp. B3I8]
MSAPLAVASSSSSAPRRTERACTGGDLVSERMDLGY